MKNYISNSASILLKAAKYVAVMAGAMLLAQSLSFGENSGDLPVLYGISGSPYVKKVQVILNEKNVSFNQVPTPPAVILKIKNLPVPQDFADASPLGKIPAYREGDWTMADSAIIAQYLEKTHPSVPLFPKDPKKLAQVLWFEKYGDEVLASVIHHKIYRERIVKPKILGVPGNEAIAQKAINDELPPMLDYLENALGNNKWIAGDDFTVADIALVVHFIDLKIAGESISAERWPKLVSYIDRVSKRPSFNS